MKFIDYLAGLCGKYVGRQFQNKHKLYEKGNVILIYYFAVCYLRELKFSSTIRAICKTKNQEIVVWISYLEVWRALKERARSLK